MRVYPNHIESYTIAPPLDLLVYVALVDGSQARRVQFEYDTLAGSLTLNSVSAIHIGKMSLPLYFSHLHE